MDDNTPRGPVSAAEFFALGLDGVTLTAAQTATGLAYTTVLRARDRGPDCDPATARKLAAWSKTVPSAQAAGVWIDAARTLGLHDASAGEAPTEAA